MRGWQYNGMRVDLTLLLKGRLEVSLFGQLSPQEDHVREFEISPRSCHLDGVDTYVQSVTKVRAGRRAVVREYIGELSIVVLS